MCAVMTALAMACVAQTQQLHEEFDRSFRPRLVEVYADAWQVRPEGRVGLLFEFANEGTGPAEIDYRVFVHVEPVQSCERIVINADHTPSSPTTSWQPGERYVDGPVEIDISALPEGEYWLHVGLYDLRSGRRKLELYWPKRLVVSAAAPPPALRPLRGDQLRERRRQWARRIVEPVAVEGKHVTVQVCRRTGAWRVVDRSTGQAWDGGLTTRGAGWAEFALGETRRRVWLTQPASVRAEGSRVVATYRPQGMPQVRCEFAIVGEGRAVEFSLQAGQGKWKLVAASMLDNCLPVSDAGKGRVFVPEYNGWEYPASSGRMFSRGGRSFTRAASFQMVGLQQSESAAMLTWNDCYGYYRVASIVQPPAPLPGAQVVVTSLWTQRPPKSWRLTVLGKGGYNEICAAYRRVAKERGLLKTWHEKWSERPGMKALAGAADMKPFVLVRLVPGTRYNRSDSERVHLSYTFDQAAELAEHWRRDLGLDRVLFVLAGWIRRGYDNQHPDILPAAPECGGNDGLAECARRVKALGYLFGLHDNYQDLYPDAPSFDLRYAIKDRSGKPVRGGEWAGGRCYLICSKMGLELARRNLPEVKRLFEPTIYFTDTTFAASLLECYDPEHPETRCDDMRYKRELALYCQRLFGGHGSEHGYEWAVPVTDYFEGNSYASHHSEVGAEEGRSIPMLELIYHDCVAIYAHQGWRLGPAGAEGVLRHLVVGRMPLYSFTGPRYWMRPDGVSVLPVAPVPPIVRPAGARRCEVVYRWELLGPMAAPGNVRCFVHFTDRGGNIKFQDDHQPNPLMESWRPGQTVQEEARVVEIPEGVAAGSYDVRVGLFAPGGGRYGLRARDDGTTRYVVGRLRVGPDGTVTFAPVRVRAMADPTVFTRADNPNTAKMCKTDRFIKNTYEFLSAVSRLCFDVPMVEHRYLREDGSVEMSRFANGCQVVINVGAEPFAWRDVVLPPYGFVARGPGLLAFYARRVGAVDYGDSGALFVARSLDGRPLRESERVRVYRAFGGPEFALETRHAALVCGRQRIKAHEGVARVRVEAEEIISPAE